MDVCGVRMSEMHLIMGKKWVAKEKRREKTLLNGEKFVPLRAIK